MHTITLGMTESGKTTLQIILATELHKRGQKVVVCETMGEPRWVSSQRFDRLDKLSEYLESERNCQVFIDECGEYFNEGRDGTYAWLATRSRHWGHSVHFIMQRYIQLPRTMRDQCSRVNVFTSSVDDGALLASEWNKNELRNCNELPQWHFYHCSRYGESKRLVIAERTKIVPYKPPTGKRISNRKPCIVSHGTDNGGNPSSAVESESLGNGNGDKR